MKLYFPLKEIYVTQKFGANPAVYAQFGMKGHNGIDYRAKYVPCFAAAEGIAYRFDSGKSGYGRHIKIAHPDGSYTIYAHLSEFKVASGQHVTAGQQIGITGNTGFSTAAHLHFGYRPKGYNQNNGYAGYVDPTPYLNQSTPPTNPGNNMSVRTELDKPALAKSKQMAFVNSSDNGEDIQDYFNTLYGGKPLGDWPMTAFIDYMWKHQNRAKRMQEIKDIQAHRDRLLVENAELKKQLANSGNVDKAAITSHANEIIKLAK